MANSSILIGKRVLVTRARPLPGAICQLCRLLQSIGAKPVQHPVIYLRPNKEQSALHLLAQLDRFKAVAFVSASGLYFFDQLAQDLAVKWRDRPLQWVSIGPSTASVMRDMGLANIKVCPDPNSSSLARWLIREIPGPVLIIRADRGSTVLADELSRARFEFAELVAYQSCDVQTPTPETVSQLQAGNIDWVTLTSSAIAKSTIHLFGAGLRETKIATIGPAVSAEVTAAGFAVTAQAATPSFSALIEAMNQ